MYSASANLCISHTSYAVTLAKLVNHAVHFHANNNFNNACELAIGCVMKIAVPGYQVRPDYASV